MNSAKKGIAIFDFDGTIIKKDSYIEFIRFTHGTAKLYQCYLVKSLYVLLYFLKLYPNYKLKEQFFSYFYKGISEDELRMKGIEFSKQKIDAYYYDYAKEILHWHKEKGHDILILTASSALWLEEWTSRNKYSLIGTTFETNNGILTGKIEGRNCYGREKARRIESMLDKYDFHQTYGYGDTKADLHFLKLTHHIHYGSLGFRREYKINNHHKHVGQQGNQIP